MTDEIDPLPVLREATRGNIRAWAKQHGFSREYIHGVLKGRRPPSERLLKALGLKRAVISNKEAMPR